MTGTHRQYLTQSKLCGEYLKGGLGRSVPAMQSIVKTDPWWFDDPHHAAYVKSALLGPTVPVSALWDHNSAPMLESRTSILGDGLGDIITS